MLVFSKNDYYFFFENLLSCPLGIENSSAVSFFSPKSSNVGLTVNLKNLENRSFL